MASRQQQQGSSVSDGDQRYAKFDEKKRKRMISNRESARRSRMRKQQHTDDLINQINQLQEQNRLITQEIDAVSQMYVGVASDNNVLRAQVSELSDRLQSLNAVLHIAEEVRGFAVDIPEFPETLLEPWRLSYPIQQQITTSANMFHC